MEITCAWCDVPMGQMNGDGRSHGLCPTCLPEKLADLPPGVTLTKVLAVQPVQCIVCETQPPWATLVLIHGEYLCFPCLKRARPFDYRQLHEWVTLLPPP